VVFLEKSKLTQLVRKLPAFKEPEYYGPKREKQKRENYITRNFVIVPLT